MKNAVLFAIATILASAPAMALDIKGIEVDKPVNCEQIKALETRTGTFARSCENGSDKWIVQISFLSGTANMWLQQSPERILLSVHLSKFNFEEALEALSMKWGQPEIRKSTVQNRMGATFEQVEAIWKDGSVKIQLSKHGPELDKPSLFMMGEEGMKASRKDKEQKSQRNRENI